MNWIDLQIFWNRWQLPILLVVFFFIISYLFLYKIDQTQKEHFEVPITKRSIHPGDLEVGSKALRRKAESASKLIREIDRDSQRAMKRRNKLFEPEMKDSNHLNEEIEIGFEPEIETEIEIETETETKNNYGNYSKLACTRDEDCNQVWGDGDNICKSDGSCYCNRGSGNFCQIGPTFYKDPKDMSSEELKAFKGTYPLNGTVQDYINWLKLWKNEPEMLEEPHYRNFMKWRSTGRLSKKDLPKRTFNPPPISKTDYFKQMYKDGRFYLESVPAVSKSTYTQVLGPYKGYNYSDYNDYIPPQGVEFDVVTDIPEKRDPFELNYYLRPRVTTGGERTHAGRILKAAGQNIGNIKSEFYHKLDNPRTDLGGARREVIVTDNYGPGDDIFV